MIWLWRSSRPTRTTTKRFSTPNNKVSLLIVSLMRITACACFSSVSSAFVAASSSHPVSTGILRRFATSSALDMDPKNNGDDVRSLAKEIEGYSRCISSAVTLSNAHVTQYGHGDQSQMLLRVTRTVEDIDNDKKRNYDYILPISTSSNNDDGAKTTPAFFPIMPPTEVNANIQMQLPSPSGDKLAIVRSDDNTKSGSSGPARQVLEVWTTATTTTAGPSLTRRIALPTNQQHGKVIQDAATFGKPSWSPDEKVLVYAVERLPPKTTSFFDPQNFLATGGQGQCGNKPNSIPGGTSTLGLGKSEGWGEQYYHIEPLLDFFLVNIETGRISKVENVPGMPNNNDDDGDPSSLGSYSLGQAIFAPDGMSLVYTGWDAGGGSDMPKRLGLIYCQQRACKLYTSSIAKELENIAKPVEYPLDPKDDADKATATEAESDFVCLTPNLRLAKSPRFSPPDKQGTSKLVFLGSEKGFDTHFGHMGLHSMDWKNGAADISTEQVVVKQRWDIRDTAALKDEGLVENISFPGLAMAGLLLDPCFVSPDTMVTSTMWGSSLQIVRINVNDGKVRLVRACVQGSNSIDSNLLTTQDLLCVTPSGGIVVNETAPNKPGVIAYMTAKEVLKDNVVNDGASAISVASLAPLAVSTCAPVPISSAFMCEYSYQMLTLERPSGDNQWSAPVQCVLLLPPQTEKEAKPPPMIVLPHGGPHSVSTASFVPEMGYLCGQSGYALLLVNYRGSVGFGQAAVEDLPSRIGDLDVKDVVHAVNHVADAGLVDPERLAICGGSHGGFLTGHCIGQYPDLFKAACMRNPVTNIASMMTSTDIPDWAVIEACGLGTYDWEQYNGASAEQLIEMYEKSPVAHSKNVKTPTLVALGTKDLRVPPSQGLEYYHILRSQGVPTKLLLYDDCDHPIGAVCSKADHWINIKIWFDKYVL